MERMTNLDLSSLFCIGVDFIPLSTEITFSSGSMLGSRECVAVTIINNNEVEFDEMFELQLDFNPAQVPVEAGERNKAVVVIVVESEWTNLDYYALIRSYNID